MLVGYFYKENYMAKAKQIIEAINRMGTRSRDSVWISSGSTYVDLITGCGRGLGIETGQLISICGPSGGGKSLATMQYVAGAHYMYSDRAKFKIADSENGNSFDTEGLYGFAIADNNLCTARTVEDTHADMNLFLDSLDKNHVGVYVIDSLDGLIGEEIEDIIDERTDAYYKDKDYDKGSFQGGKAKYLSSTMLPDLASKLVNKNSVAIVTSQVRDNMNAGMYGPKERVTGGRALLFYSHTQIWIKRKCVIEEEGTKIGMVMEYEVKKGRGPTPYRTGLVTMYYRMGVDGLATDVDYLFDFRSDDTGKLLSRSDKPVVFNGLTHENRDVVIQYIDQNDLIPELRQAVIDKWEEHEKVITAGIAGRKNRFMYGK
jgi:RecA/RadA recombinase